MKALIKIDSSRYPSLLKTISSPPLALYYKGKWDGTIFVKCLAVVGSRKMTSYGRRITQEWVFELAASGITIVSGFMYGIDACAHEAALKAGGRTIAVMPCGVEVIHPSHQEDLYKEIIKKDGLILSEYEPNYPPGLWTYPKRNRIVAGLSQATLVVEAGLESGALITAQLTKDYKRKLFALPGPTTSLVSLGTLQLIKEKMADMVTQPQDILTFYGINKESGQEKQKQFLKLNDREKKVIKNLQKEPLKFDDLALLSEIASAELGAVISLLQLRGIIFEEEGKYQTSLIF